MMTTPLERPKISPSSCTDNPFDPPPLITAESGASQHVWHQCLSTEGCSSIVDQPLCQLPVATCQMTPGEPPCR